MRVALFSSLWMVGSLGPVGGTEPAGAPDFRQHIQPILSEYCYDCHADGMNKGGVSLDGYDPAGNPADSRKLWERVLRNLRSGTMPPHDKSQPAAGQRDLIVRWIKAVPFDIDPTNPDPGTVTVRRLNRVEYRHTIRDLLGVDFDTEAVFPPDDTGHGFDNIGDVLTLPPMLLEKYLMAARTIVAEAVPTASRVIEEKVVHGGHFLASDKGGAKRDSPLTLSYYEPSSVSAVFHAQHDGQYELLLDLMVLEKHVDDVFDYNKCLLTFSADAEEMLQKEFTWEGGKKFQFTFEQQWNAGAHQLTFDLQPLTPDAEQIRTLRLQVNSVTVRGPVAQEHWVEPQDYRRIFPDEVPATDEGRRAYAQRLLSTFAARAFRRPADEETVERLTSLAEQVYGRSGETFESGVAQAMVAVLASPRFLFREERAEAADRTNEHPLVDEYSLASRLSYFLWSSMPDDELFRLAAAGELRENLHTQVRRMLANWRSDQFIRNFTGQWLRARDVESVQIEERAVLEREDAPNPELQAKLARFRELRRKPDRELTEEEQKEMAALRPEVRQWSRRPLRAELDAQLRRAMRRETEMHFQYVMEGDRSLLELLDSNYTFLNERLANHYGISGVEGNEMRRVELEAESPRGGLLTQGTVLTVTSNPTRTSPVKRGVFILDNVLGAPPPPPPPNIPSLEDAAKDQAHGRLSLRETLALHREDRLCSSCHNRMDPLGLAMENFNAMGMWRDQEEGEPIDSQGTLITGESFQSVRELKMILVQDHSQEFYRALTEKLLTYALGRGLDYYDVEAVDHIVQGIVEHEGRSSALLMGIIDSPPFQRTRAAEASETTRLNPPLGSSHQRKTSS